MLLFHSSLQLEDLGKVQARAQKVLAVTECLHEHEPILKRVLHDVLCLINFLNQGTSNECAPGFQLGSLVQFLQVRGEGGKSLAHFIAQRDPTLRNKLPLLVLKLKSAR